MIKVAVSGCKSTLAAVRVIGHSLIHSFTLHSLPFTLIHFFIHRLGVDCQSSTMSAPQVYQLSLGPLTGLAFSADRSRTYGF